MKIVIVETGGMLPSIQKSIDQNFPDLAHGVVYQDNFESALEVIAGDEKIIVITTNDFNEPSGLYRARDKNANSLARIAKEKNLQAEVYCFASRQPIISDCLDRYFQVDSLGYNIDFEILKIFFKLGLVTEMPVRKKRWKKLLIRILIILGILIFLTLVYAGGFFEKLLFG